MFRLPFSPTRWAVLGLASLASASPAYLQARQAVTPAGETTADIARPLIGSVPYGVDIASCSIPGRVALTFDDGPSAFTPELLDILDEYNAKVTFFITGANFAVALDDCNSDLPGILKRAQAAGHQIAQHTWTHPELTTLSPADFNNQLYLNEMAMRNVLGLIPTYARAPYFACDGQCLARFGALGYHVVSTDLDTNDWRFVTPETHQAAKDNFANGLAGRDSALVLAHDIHPQSVRNLTRFILDTLRERGLGTSVTVGECLGDPAGNWYRAAGPVVECPASFGDARVGQIPSPDAKPLSWSPPPGV